MHTPPNIRLNTPLNIRHATPDKDAIALLPAFERLGPERITLVASAAQAREAYAHLARATAWGFDTESKPTFKVGEVSDGPHIVQLSTPERAWVFQLHDAPCRDVVAALLAHPGVPKAGFGLGDDNKRIVSKLRGDLYASLLSQEIGFFDTQKTGELSSRLSSDAAVLQIGHAYDLASGYSRVRSPLLR